MYDYIKGKLAFISPTKITIEINGIGYIIHIPLSTYCDLPQLNNSITCFTSLIVKEDSHTLYGFIIKQERDLFESVITVSGIGPKTGLALIGHLDINNFKNAISSSDIKLISKVPGIGKKTAERLVIEMRDKIKLMGKEISIGKSSGHAIENRNISDALNALLNLGYNHLQAQKAVNQAVAENNDENDPGKLISLALKKL